MARFSTDQAAGIAAIQQVINEWGNELDANNGLAMLEAGVLAQACRYFVGGEWREGATATAAFYKERFARLEAGEGAPVMRHIITNFRIAFAAADKASVNFQLVYFAAVGTIPIIGHADPLAVADVRMECVREADGHWRISQFDSGQSFRRV